MNTKTPLNPADISDAEPESRALKEWILPGHSHHPEYGGTCCQGHPKYGGMKKTSCAPQLFFLSLLFGQNEISGFKKSRSTRAVDLVEAGVVL